MKKIQYIKTFDQFKGSKINEAAYVSGDNQLRGFNSNQFDDGSLEPMGFYEQPDGSLKITIGGIDEDELEKMKEFTGDDDAFLSEFFASGTHSPLCNGYSLVHPENKGLTESPMITDKTSLQIHPNDWTEEDKADDGAYKLWYKDNYMIRSVQQDLLERGYTIFQANHFDGETNDTNENINDVKTGLSDEDKIKIIIDHFIKTDSDEDLLDRMKFSGNEQEHLYGDVVKDRVKNHDYIFRKIEAENSREELLDQYSTHFGEGQTYESVKVNKFVPTIEFNVGDIVFDNGNDCYGMVLSNYGNAIDGDGGEIRLDSDGNQCIFTYTDDFSVRTGYNLVKQDLSDAKIAEIRKEHINSLKPFIDNYKNGNPELYELLKNN